MDMTGKERLLWLKQIKRIHQEQKIIRDKEFASQINSFVDDNERI